MQGSLWEGATSSPWMPMVARFCLFCIFHAPSEFMQKPPSALYWFPVFLKLPGCCEVSTLRSGWWKAERQRGAERKSPTKPRGRGKKEILLQVNTAEIVLNVFCSLVYCESLSYGWIEIGKAGPGGLAHCRKIISPGYIRQMAVVWWSFAMCDREDEGDKVPWECAVPEGTTEHDLERIHNAWLDQKSLFQPQNQLSHNRGLHPAQHPSGSTMTSSALWREGFQSTLLQALLARELDKLGTP